MRRAASHKEVWWHADNTGGAQAIRTSTKSVIASQLRSWSFGCVTSWNSYRFSVHVANAIHLSQSSGTPSGHMQTRRLFGGGWSSWVQCSSSSKWGGMWDLKNLSSLAMKEAGSGAVDLTIICFHISVLCCNKSINNFYCVCFHCCTFLSSVLELPAAVEAIGTSKEDSNTKEKIETATARTEAKPTTHVVCVAHMLTRSKPYTRLEHV